MGSKFEDFDFLRDCQTCECLQNKRLWGGTLLCTVAIVWLLRMFTWP
jgi:hypothetical protein